MLPETERQLSGKAIGEMGARPVLKGRVPNPPGLRVAPAAKEVFSVLHHHHGLLVAGKLSPVVMLCFKALPDLPQPENAYGFFHEGGIKIPGLELDKESLEY